MDNPPFPTGSNPLLDWYSAALTEAVGRSLPSNQEPLDLTRTLRSSPQPTRNLGVNRCRLNAGRHPVSKGPCQPLCDLCRGINVERLTQLEGYLHAGDMNRLNFDPEDPSKHCILCNAFSWGIEKAADSGNRTWRGKVPLGCRLINAGTKSSKIELSNDVLDGLSCKYDVEFGLYCDEGEYYLCISC
jgi:hypothetical protein